MTDPSLPRKQHPTVEETPYSVEDTGVESGDKLDRLLATAVTVRQELHDKTRKLSLVFMIVTPLLILSLGFGGGVLWGLRDQATELQAIARENRENGRITRQNGDILLDATGPEARARSATTLSKAINEIGRTGICAAFYAVDEYPPACANITATMDRMRAGGTYEGP